jgi:endonuclease III
MSKASPAPGALRKIIRRLLAQAPPGGARTMDPLARLVRAFFEYDADLPRAEAAEGRILAAVADYNELRVTPVTEIATLLGVRYPFAEARCQALRRTLQAIFEREHHMSLDCLKDMKKSEVCKYLRTLTGIPGYVEAVVALECCGVHTLPVDTKLLLWLKHKRALPADTTIPQAQELLEKQVRADQLLALHRAARRELEGWSPKSWPAPEKPAAVAPPPAPTAQPAAAAPPSRPAKPAAAASKARPAHQRGPAGTRAQHHRGQ